jgi:TRAP-type C4-dicarboxylate transport system permease small subunit
MQFDPRYQRARQEASRRLPLTLIIVILVILTGIFGWDYIQRAGDPQTTTTTAPT